MAGPRKSGDPQIYSDVITILEQVINIFTAEENESKVELEQSRMGRSLTPPKTVEEAVDRLIDELSLKDKTSISNLADDELINLHINLGEYIRNEFGLWSGNADLMSSCCAIAKADKIHGDTASTIIIKELWERLRETHKLRVVK